MIRLAKIEHSVRALFPAMEQYFSAREVVEFAYLFGSYGKHQETQSSDVDIAVFLSTKVPPKEYFDLRLSMMSDLFNVLRTYEVDLIVLNQADLCLAHKAIAPRTVVFERNSLARIEFEVNTVGKYFDSKPFRKVQQDIYLRQIREGKIFG